MNQPPSGGCVLKRLNWASNRIGTSNQPPSGGCVLKQQRRSVGVEAEVQPPSGGCVLKLYALDAGRCDRSPAAFGRLCVETAFYQNFNSGYGSSRLRAAVC